MAWTKTQRQIFSALEEMYNDPCFHRSYEAVALNAQCLISVWKADKAGTFKKVKK